MLQWLTLAIMLFPITLIAGDGSTDPFEPTPCIGSSYPDPTPDPYPEPEPVPPAYENISCTINAVVTAEQRFRDRSDAEQACDNWGRDFCQVKKRNNRFDAIFKQKIDLSGKGSDISSIRVAIFSELGNYLESNGLLRPIFELSASFDACEQKGY